MIVGLYSPAPRSGKTTVSRFLINRYNFIPVSFAEPLKVMLKGFLGTMGFGPNEIWEMTYGDRKESAIPGFNFSPRFLMQTLGTEWGRDTVDPNIWIDIARRRVTDLTEAGERVVVDDVRFLNEAMLIRRMGGKLVQIFRPGVVNIITHSSEGRLAGCSGFDAVFFNDRDIAALEQQADEFYRTWR